MVARNYLSLLLLDTVEKPLLISILVLSGCRQVIGVTTPTITLGGMVVKQMKEYCHQVTHNRRLTPSANLVTE